MSSDSHCTSVLLVKPLNAENRRHTSLQQASLTTHLLRMNGELHCLINGTRTDHDNNSNPSLNLRCKEKRSRVASWYVMQVLPYSRAQGPCQNVISISEALIRSHTYNAPFRITPLHFESQNTS